MHCLIVGGAGVLRPAALHLLHDGRTVTATARTHSSIDSLAEAADSQAILLHGIAGDYERPGALERALVEAIAARDAFGLALIYTPGSATIARAALAAHPPAVMVDLLTSAHAAPGIDRGERPPARLAPRGDGDALAHAERDLQRRARGERGQGRLGAHSGGAPALDRPSRIVRHGSERTGRPGCACATVVCHALKCVKFVHIEIDLD